VVLQRGVAEFVAAQFSADYLVRKRLAQERCRSVMLQRGVAV